MDKKFWQSKTLWANAIAMTGAMFSGPTLGHVFAPEEVAAGLGIMNILLRLTTQKGLTT